MDSATLTKFLDFVSFDVRHVQGSKNFFEKFQNITRRQRGDPSKTETRAESAPPAYNVIPEPSPDRVNPSSNYAVCKSTSMSAVASYPPFN